MKERKTLGKVSEEKAQAFIAKFHMAELGSKDRDGLRRVVTFANGKDLFALQNHFCEFTGEESKPLVSVPILSPGIKDPIPCVACMKSHTFDWANSNPVIGEHLLFLRRFASGLERIPEPPQRSGQRGILYVGGGAYWPGIYVGIRLLRESGCTLPIQVWYRGEMEPVQPDKVTGLNVDFIDASKHAAENGGARILGGWEAKLWAISHCGLDQILYLDADAYCVTDPTAMIAELDDSEPFEFWQDGPDMEGKVDWVKVWPSAVNDRVPQIQGGQLLIDIPRAWKLIMLSHWMCQHSDFYFKHMFGDQDVWRVAATALKQKDMWKNRGQAPWVGPAFVLPDSDGETCIIHRCAGKLFEHRHIPNGDAKYLRPWYDLPKESRVFTLLNEVADTWNSADVFREIYRKKLWGKTDPSGPGSTKEQSQPWVDYVNQRIVAENAKTVIDLGSGSMSVVNRIKARSIIPIDVHSVDGAPVTLLDFARYPDQIPSGDMLLCKDVIHHWSNAMIQNLLRYLTEHRGKWKTILFCFDCNQIEDGADCPVGTYRALNPAMRPLSEFRLTEEFRFIHKIVVSLQTS